MTDQSHQCVIIGIAGASASGKSLIASTLYRELREQVGDEHIGVIPEDCYYKDQSHLSMEERVKTNYDHPSAMDHSLLLEHLQALKRGSAISASERSTAGSPSNSPILCKNRFIRHRRRVFGTISLP